MRERFPCHQKTHERETPLLQARAVHRRLIERERPVDKRHMLRVSVRRRHVLRCARQLARAAYIDATQQQRTPVRINQVAPTFPKATAQCRIRQIVRHHGPYESVEETRCHIAKTAMPRDDART